MSIEGKSCIVTGAASGVGRTIARCFAEAGAHVTLADMDEERLKEAVATLVDDGFSAQAFSGDLSRKLTVANLISATIDAFDRIDILINASRKLSKGDPLNSGCDLMTEMFEQNVVANLRVTQAVARKMTKQAEAEENSGEAGTIVNVTSIAAERTLRNLGAYSISCAALNQMTRTLAVELAQDRIRVNAVALGSVMSSWMRNALKDDESLREKVVAATPLGRIGDPEEAARVALYLASPGASFVTGQIISCDGGRSLLEPMDIPTY